MDRAKWENRILTRINKTKTCWLWMGYTNQGYGYVKWDGKTESVHRFVFQKLKAQIPYGLVLDHVCRVKKCVNPSHLEVVTHRENILRGVGRAAKNSRKTHCKHHHKLTKANSYSDPGTTWRRCRKCMIKRTTEWRQRCSAI